MCVCVCLRLCQGDWFIATGRWRRPDPGHASPPDASRRAPTSLSNENILVCAPTGAGKTNIAMIAVLREVGAHRDAASGRIDKGAFKIVYVAPMKALAAEVGAAVAAGSAHL